MKGAVLGAIRFYQRALSPLKPPSCRFEPTCSTYMLQAVERFGTFHGVRLGLWRILRCHPFTRGGFDPVPEVLGARKLRAERDDETNRPD